MHELHTNKIQILLNFLSTTRKKALLILLFTSIACLRFYYCTQLPVSSGDLPRHIYYGFYAAKIGLTAAGHSLVELSPFLSGVVWSSLPYNYPIVALLFFTLIGKLSPTIFFAKLVLTLIEAINSWLVFKYSRQHLLALLYWASPISIWWVSHEGQFEPLQSLFAIGALLTLQDRKYLAFILLALAIQVKITALLFLPYFVLGVRRDNLKDLLIAFIAFPIGFVPTLFAMLHYPIITQIMSTVGACIHNPYYWNVLKYSMFDWNPWWLVVLDQCSTYGILLLLLIWTIRLRGIRSFFAPVCFIIFCKISSICQFWYFVLFMPFLLPIQDNRKRFLLFALTPLLDISSLIEIISGWFGHVFGYNVGDYYKGVDVFMKLII